MENIFLRLQVEQFFLCGFPVRKQNLAKGAPQGIIKVLLQTQFWLY